MRNGLLVALLLSLLGCVRVPAGLEVVEEFEVEPYLGRWYEIARLDHSFERGLTRVTADYSLRDDGSIRVVNRGFDQAAGRWKEVEGRARLAGRPGEGRLKVSFFGPFYGAYNILALDHRDYGYALVSGPTRNYLWILAREPVLDPRRLAELVDKARGWGFAVDRLIYVEH